MDLLVVSKKQSPERMQTLIDYQPGIQFGENYVQEFELKKPHLAGNYQVHLIGPLQSNKVRKAVSLFNVIQSVGSLKIAELISQEAEKQGKIQKVFLQVNISEDQGKAGFLRAEIEDLFFKIIALPNLEILGLMTITRFYSNIEDVVPDFQQMSSLRERILKRYQIPNLLLSMGMSADYDLAIKAGADLVRVGTSIFGER